MSIRILLNKQIMSTQKRSWLLQEFVGHNTGVSCLVLGHKSGRVLATGGENGQVSLWGVDNPTCIMSLNGPSSAVETLQFSDTEELLCAGSRSGTLKIWDVSASKVVRNLTGHKAAVTCIDFHSYGDFIASGSQDNKLKMWDIRRKGCIHTYSGYTGKINSIQFSPDGRWIASASDDKTCKIWDLAAGKLLHQFTDHSSAVNSLNFHSCELLLATGSSDKTVNIYDVEQFTNILTTDNESSAVNKVLFSEDGNYFYSVSHDICRVYKMNATKCIDTFIVKWGTPSDISLSHNQLIGASYLRNIVSLYVVDLAQVGKGVPQNENIPQQAQLQSKNVPRRQPLVNAANSRPFTAPTGVPNARKFEPEKMKQTNQNNNIQEKYFEIPPNSESIFKPTQTLSRSPPQKEVKVHKSLSDTTKVTQRTEKIIPVREVTKPVPYVPVPQAFVQPQPVEPTTHPAAKQSNFSFHGKPPVEIPTRDVDNKPQQDIPSTSNVLPPQFPPFPNGEVNSDLNDSRLSTLVPSERKDPIGLDLKAFLPPPKDVTPTKKELTDDDALVNIKKGFESMSIVLKSRARNLDIVRALWRSGDVMTAINTAIRMNDNSVTVDLLGVLNLKQSLWSLELCQVMLPQLKELICSKYETYVTTTCTSLRVIFKNFGALIQSNVKAPPNNIVDISREERYNKCLACYKQLIEIKEILSKKYETSGKIGSQFREINILLTTLE